MFSFLFLSLFSVHFFLFMLTLFVFSCLVGCRSPSRGRGSASHNKRSRHPSSDRHSKSIVSPSRHHPSNRNNTGSSSHAKSSSSSLYSANHPDSSAHAAASADTPKEPSEEHLKKVKQLMERSVKKSLLLIFFLLFLSFLLLFLLVPVLRLRLSSSFSFFLFSSLLRAWRSLLFLA